MLFRNIMRAAVVLAALLPVAAPVAAAPRQGLPQMLHSRGPVNQQALVTAMLSRHNHARRQAGVAPVAWDPALAEGARVYANQLARLDQMRHSPKAMRPGQGENLWMGTRDYFPLTTMVDAWASEAAMFRPALFPNVSRTGNWADVGHYTQMIWPGTQRIGCAVGKSARNDMLVCRYWPAGNVTGRPVP